MTAVVVRTASPDAARAAIQLAHQRHVVLLRPDVTVDVDDEDDGPGLTLATSGTTGSPKLVRHDIDRLHGRVRQGSPDDRWLLTYAPASYAGVQVIAHTIASGCQLHGLTNPTVSTLANLAHRAQVTHASGTPTFWRTFLHHLGDRTFPLRQATLGGEAVDQSTLDRIRARFPAARVAHIYASTEAGAVFSVADGVEGFPAAWFTTGVDGCELRIVDGVLEVLSPRRMVGDGWIRTGDRVEHSDGRVRFCGREDTLVNVGGVKVRPEHVENVLREVPGVVDVCVEPVPSSLVGCLLRARVVTDGTDETVVRAALTAHARARLDRVVVPRLVEFVSDLGAGKKPRTVATKTSDDARVGA